MINRKIILKEQKLLNLKISEIISNKVFHSHSVSDVNLNSVTDGYYTILKLEAFARNSLEKKVKEISQFLMALNKFVGNGAFACI